MSVSSVSRILRLENVIQPIPRMAEADSEPSVKMRWGMYTALPPAVSKQEHSRGKSLAPAGVTSIGTYLGTKFFSEVLKGVGVFPPGWFFGPLGDRVREKCLSAT